MFAFLASVHRVAPQLEESTEEQENSEQTRDGPLTVKYVHNESKIPLCKIVKNKPYHRKILLDSFHLNGHT